MRPQVSQSGGGGLLWGATTRGDSSLRRRPLLPLMTTPPSLRCSLALFALLLAGACEREPSSGAARALPAARTPARQASVSAIAPAPVATVEQQGDTGAIHHVAPKQPLLTEAE